MTEHPEGPDARAGDATDVPERDQVAPSKPVTPLSPRRSAPSPEPVDVEVDESVIVSPVASPSPDEVAPEPRGPFETMPQDAPAVADGPLTSIQLLGRAAAANASLSASGAPTPLGGIPRVDANGAAPADLGDSEPRWVPTFAGAAAAPGDEPRVSTPEPAIASAADLRRHHLDADTPLYRPRVAASEDGTEGPGSPPDTPAPPPAVDLAERRPGRAWPLVLIGLLTIAAITLAILWPALHPAAIDIPAQRVMSAPAGAVVEPIELEEPTPFLAAMPLVAGTWALTAVDTHAAASDEALPGRVAEWHTLTYSDGTEEVTVEARQLYTEDDAHLALVAAAGSDAELTDATAGGQVVGERAELSDEEDTRVMWTHGSAYFEAVGAAGTVDGLVEALGL
ncbi:hypothetical protein QQX10_06810 [Demequina sp. SYSU T00039]|uniref:DUF4367 domain-containing protein n=1 Tax=Demequina lignilytica TaxID=3051663 RepID=A0AAW7M507_9MICO|nr:MULTISPECIES: hypothetical protein [unclassified Demequina]MDN4477968.1 hypothetical protein [Demequina sp. SYSU T00039-1]MDN4487877.1 hypothetical protein [Demequina sp. SYSU T00039]MDN4490740.1 hypothetical protein [Demequina sp. SYSU T00068]